MYLYLICSHGLKRLEICHIEDQILIKYLKLLCYEVDRMSNSYTREDVQSLLNQLKKYRKVIREYQENDLEYCQIRSEMKKVKSKLTETRKRLLQMEEKYKDCLFDYHKIKEDKESLLQELNELKKELKHTKTMEKTTINNQRAESLPDKKEQQREKVLLHAVDLSTGNNKSTESVHEHSSIMKDLDKSEHQKELRQFNISILNRLFIDREEFKDIMSIYKDNNRDGATGKSNRESIGKQYFESTVIKGAEPSNDAEQGSDSQAKGTEKDKVDVSQVNTTLTSLQSQIMEIKKILEERKPSKESRSFPSTTSPAPIPTPPKKELTFRDLRGLTNVTSVPGRTPENKTTIRKNGSTKLNQPNPSSKQKGKPVYVRNIEVKENKKVKNNDPKEEQVEQEQVQGQQVNQAEQVEQVQGQQVNQVEQVEQLLDQQRNPVENVVEITSFAPAERVNQVEYVQHFKPEKLTKQPSRQEEIESKDGEEQLHQVENMDLSTPQADEESPLLSEPDTVMEKNEKEATVMVEQDRVTPNEQTESVQKEPAVENIQEEPSQEDKFTLKSFWKKLKKFYG